MTLSCYTRLSIVLCLGLSLVSCNENEQPKSQPPVRNTFLQSLQGGTVTYAPNANVSGQMTPAGPRNELSLPGASLTPVTAQQQQQQSQEPPLQIPSDARWTLYCATVTGPDRFTRLAQMKAYLIANSPFKDWYVIHNEQDSTLFYGFFRSIETNEDPRAAAAAHAQRKAVAEWKDSTGARPFAGCFFTPISPPNPVAPAEWNLANAPANAFWSVQIMAFKDHPLRKQAAVEAVKDLRAKGVEAYYYHGQTISSVCVGAWPRQAVKEQDVAAGQAVNEDDAVMVSNVPLPERYKNARLKTADGQRLVSYAQRVEIADPSLSATIKQYPQHAVNYEFHSRKVKAEDGKVVDVPDPSFLVIIPREEPSGLSDTGGGAAGQGVQGFLNPSGNRTNAAERAAEPTLPAGAGRLRGLGN
jgi:hypothetical protein